jgi:hypothetical protein
VYPLLREGHLSAIIAFDGVPRCHCSTFATNAATYAYRVDAPDQETAEKSIAAYSGAQKWEPIEASDVPPDMTFKLSTVPSVFVSERGERPNDPRDPTSTRNP